MMIMVTFTIVSLFWQTKVMYMIYCGLGVFLFSTFIVIDTQIMMGNNYVYSISPEEYIFASLNLYIDIINMFLYILQLISLLNSED